MGKGELRSGPGFGEFGLTVGRTAELCGARLEPGPGLSADEARVLSERAVAGIATDSRAVETGDLFWALRGERFDGADYVAKASAGGALAAVVAEASQVEVGAILILRVPDPLKALGDLAAAVRRLSGCPVLAVTGSVGKTTVKDSLGSILRASGRRTLITPGNFNNLVGAPLTLLSLSPSTEAVALELGSSATGEIARLTEIALPDVGLVTALGEAHLEFFGNLDEVAREKGALYRGLKEDGAAVVNADDPRLKAHGETFVGARLLFGGSKSGAHVRLVDREDLGLSGQRLTFAGPGLGPDGLTAFVKLLGRAGAANALAAVSAALAAGVVRSDVAAGLSAVEPSPGRLRPVVGRDGLRLIDDSYNANPTSMRAGLEFLGALVDVPGRGAILGDMLELGTEAARSHRLLGRLAAGVGLDFLALVGELSAETAAGAIEAGFDPKAAAVFDDPLSAAEWAAERAIPGAAVLIKASRSVGLDKATERLSSGEATSGVESP